MTMTRDEIIEMARQAGIVFDDRAFPFYEAFAKLCFEKGRQQGTKQENALWKLAETSRDIGYDK